MSIFSRIAAGEIPSYKVAADDRHFAFLDINPMAPGHTLVIPRREVDYLFDLTPQEYADLWAFAREVALKLKKAVPCKRVGVAVLGMEVPHAHIHLVPLQSESDMDFRAPKLSLPAEEMERIASAIASA
ncbi:putative HIT-like protein [Muribaculaceae bacterium]|jgi:histidine triad (HIT) family protein|nr:HIT family protein [Muribaculaceae bacterium]GFI05805.1 putative HIT-like protein [Muribaculaceae bacterium]